MDLKKDVLYLHILKKVIDDLLMAKQPSKFTIEKQEGTLFMTESKDGSGKTANKYFTKESIQFLRENYNIVHLSGESDEFIIAIYQENADSFDSSAKLLKGKQRKILAADSISHNLWYGMLKPVYIARNPNHQSKGLPPLLRARSISRLLQLHKKKPKFIHNESATVEGLEFILKFGGKFYQQLDTRLVEFAIPLKKKDKPESYWRCKKIQEFKLSGRAPLSVHPEYICKPYDTEQSKFVKIFFSVLRDYQFNFKTEFINKSDIDTSEFEKRDCVYSSLI